MTIPASHLFNEMMKNDPEFREEYARIGPAYDAIWARIDAARCNVLQQKGTVSENEAVPSRASRRR